MIQSKKVLLLALMAPIVALGILAAYKAHIISNGRKFTFPVEGYDPRHFLAGHFVLQTVDYGVPVCPKQTKPYPAHVCLEPKKYFTRAYPSDCQWFVKGHCRRGRFEAGIERYYLPKKAEKPLSKILSDKKRKVSVVVSVLRNGTAQIADLLIDGKPFRPR